MNTKHFYIDGQWVEPKEWQPFDVINPATEEVITTVADATLADADSAVAAAKSAFRAYSITQKEDRLKLLEKLYQICVRRKDDFVDAVRKQKGCPCRYGTRNASTVRPC